MNKAFLNWISRFLPKKVDIRCREVAIVPRCVSGGSTVTINMPLYRVLHRAKNPQQQQRHHNTVAQCYTEIQTALRGYTQLHKVIINMVTSSFETDTFCLLVIIEQSRAWVGGSLGCAKQPGATVWGVELETRNFFEINLKLYFIFH